MSSSERAAWALCVAIVGIPITSVVRGYVIAKIWLWFVAQQFGLPALNVPQAMGVGLLVGLMTYHYAKTEDQSFLGSRLIASVFISFTSLGIAAIFALFL